jgi:chemosensory pili system protein ChpA (sensor histidine kinase/response regulator)
MTTQSSPPVRENFDTGPLSWVMGEIREALTKSKTAIQDASTQDAEARSTTLRHAKSYLHQAHGALQIVDVDGVAIITETIEDLLDRLESGQVALTPETTQAISNSYQAVIEYLEELLSGAQHQPVRLFPYYKALLEVRGAERIHPADLFFPNLSIRPKLPLASPDMPRPDYLALRQRFEKALLPFLRKADPATELANAALMGDIIGDVERVQSNQQTRGFWWVMRGFAEVVSSGKIKNELYVKQLFARINMQIRRLSEGSSSIGERLMRDALFFIAKAEDPSPATEQIRAAYQLDGLVPTDYDKKRYGQIDMDALVAAKERLSQAKNMWNRIAGGDGSVSETFEQEMTALADVSARLNSPSLSKLLKELNGIARHAAHSNPGDSLGLEVATTLLFVENALNHTSRLSDDFAERADAMTARLLAIVAGEKPGAAAQWLDDMSREAQQRQTMMVLAAEMQSSLSQVEKLLDEFFSNPAKRTTLAPIDPVLHQIEGALAILDQDDAMKAVQHTRQAVRGFVDADPDTSVDPQEFQHVAQNVGALSFFIETLQLYSEGVKKRFSFDAEKGVFQANLLEKGSGPNSPPEIEVDAKFAPAAETPPVESPQSVAVEDVSTVESDLAYHQQQSAELAKSLAAQPDNTSLQEQLKESLSRVRSDAALVDNPEANDRAQAAIKILESPDFAASEGAFAEIVSATATSPAAVAVPMEPPAAAAPASDEAIDAELLEIFLSEAEEVLECVAQTLPQLRNEANNQDHLTTLRRSFHTLKGSGRMVGLMAFGDAGWSIEQVLNLRLSNGQGGSPDLYALLDKAVEILGAWVVDLQTQGSSARTPTSLVNAAERMKQGEPFSFDEGEGAAAPVQAAPAAEPAAPIEQVEEPVAQVEEPKPEVAAPVFVERRASQEDEPAAPTSEPEQPEAGAPSAESELPSTLPQAEEAQMSDADLAAFHIPGSGFEVASEPVPEAPASALAANTTMPELAPVGQVIEFPEVQTADLKHDDSIKRIGNLEISVPLHNIYLAETDELVRLLAHDLAEWRHEPERDVNILAVHAAHSLAGSSATVGFDPLHEVAHALEMVLQTLARKPVRLAAAEFDVLENGVECLKAMLQKFALCEMPAHEPPLSRALETLQLEITRRSGAPESGTLSSLPAFNEPGPDVDPVQPEPAAAAAPVTAAEPVPPVVQPAPPQMAASQARPIVMPTVPLEQEHAIEPLFEQGTTEAATEHSALPKDELDADLLPVFLEEGRDLLPQMGEQLRNWQTNTSDTAASQALLRHLHTIKGSARMAGAMALGQHMHNLESRIEQLTRSGAPSSDAIDELMSRLDLGLYMFDQLQNPDPSRPPPPVYYVKAKGSAAAAAAAQAAAEAAQPTDAVAKTDGQQPVVLPSLIPVTTARAFGATPTLPQTAAAPVAPVAVPLVRVRADILDRLVNQAGEVSISRSKVENEVDTLRQSLSELTENVSRLRGQLREIEIQAESQMSSQMAHSVDRGFDPLEFDRFTRLQELTRMMAESVNDVASVQQNLIKTIDGATTDLTVQARLTRDLQQDLMRVRMVQFGSISERLYRVTRQAAKELDKRINLDIRGGSVEMDRSVLEKMTGPFEHLLRNSIVHGIESREARVAAGKSEIGEMLVEVRQEGNEVVIQFSDDGQGLNLSRIREKAKSTGLLTDESNLSDAELKDLIFHPGFSTAHEVTELAGRGVGMDVVRSEAAALGGRIAIISEQGKGAHFIIQLPLTLAVTQVVLLSTGGKTFAVPSVLVEQVQQLKANPLAAAYNDGAVVWQNNRVPLYYLSALLGDTGAAPIAQQYSPLVILKSGNDRVAIHVDEVIGNREVVVKNIGPQLARMIGIAGATVLGSGNIVLILDPVPLAQRALHENLRAPRIIPSDAPSDMGAVAEMAPAAPAAPKAEPVQGLRTQHIVMVVDDSLTVRRVTQRFLVREGYQVVLAKDGVDALEQLQAITPDVMLVDIEMPRMDGFDLTRNVRSDERTRHIPIIMITSRTATKHRNYAMELGVNEYLGKPYQEADLLRFVKGFVNKEAPVG